jgi:hypothetical protein
MSWYRISCLGILDLLRSFFFTSHFTFQHSPRRFPLLSDLRGLDLNLLNGETHLTQVIQAQYSIYRGTLHGGPQEKGVYSTMDKYSLDLYSVSDRGEASVSQVNGPFCL